LDLSGGNLISSSLIIIKEWQGVTWVMVNQSTFGQTFGVINACIIGYPIFCLLLKIQGQ
jgi:hypothetical protein